MLKNRKYDIFKHRNLMGWVFCSQTVIAIVITIFYPLLCSLFLSLTDVKLNLSDFNFVGLKNYAYVLGKDSGYFRALGVSVLFSVVSTLIQTALGFFAAVMLYFLTSKLQTLFKTIIYLPVILPAAVISAMWLMVFAGDEYGLLNIIFGMTDPPYQWMSASNTVAFICLVAVNTWRYLGITMVIYFINMNSISEDIIESAQLETTSKLEIMRYIIFPMTFGATTINLLFSMIGGVKSFDLFYLFQTNGNLSQKLTPVSVLIYRAGLGNPTVADISLSRSVTMSIVLTVFLAIVTLLAQKLLNRNDEGINI